MEREESVNKALYKIELYLIKIIPMLLAFLYFINIILDYFGIDNYLISIIGGMSILPLVFFYISSYVFKFCEYHRMFLHYIVVNDVITWIDYEYTIPITDLEYLILQLCIAFVFMIIILYLKEKKK